MRSRYTGAWGWGVGVAALTTAMPAQAGLFRDVVIGVESAGFFVSGERNPLTGGDFIQLDRLWNNETLDFGAHELTLTGGMRGRAELNQRFPGTIEFSLDTRNQPLAYTYQVDTGGQLTTFNGSAFIDIDGSMNAFGFYDLRVDIGNRQTVDAEGRFQNVDNQMNDFNIGPIDVRGNIYADLLATVFDPLFTATGTNNFFADFSGRTQREQQIKAGLERARRQLDSGGVMGNSEIDALLSAAMVSEMLGDSVPDVTFLRSVGTIDSVVGDPSIGVVPEPALAALLLPAVWLAMVRRRRAA